MAKVKDFTIDRVSWHIQTEGNPEPEVQVKRRFQILVHFLQENNLLKRPILEPNAIPGNEFAILSSDLTPEGLAVIRLGYDAWLKRVVNKRKNISDLSILEDALGQVIREKP